MAGFIRGISSRHLLRHHTRDHVNRQRRMALLMVFTGSIRTIGWLLLTIAYLTHMGLAVRLFASVSFVAVLSSLALAETAWSQVAGSLAQLTAGDTHSGVLAARVQASIDFDAVERDLAHLTELEPGEEAQELAAGIRLRLRR